MSQLSEQRRPSEGPARAEASARILDLVAEPLVEVEALFRAHLESPVKIVEEIGEFVRDGGGKRVRPTLHLLCARLFEDRGPHDVLLATVLEYIHTATLIHDDVIDEAETRRGKPAVHREWGNTTSILFGDYLLAKAMELALRAGSMDVMQRLAQVTLRMTEGEMLQTRYQGRLDLTRRDYLDLVERKTASLFACGCEMAGLVRGRPDPDRDALRRYGLYLGMEFQIVDDLLDLTGEEADLGKPAATDLSEGKATLAVLDLLESGTAADRRRIGAIISGEAGPRELAGLQRLLIRSGAVDRAYTTARKFAVRAAAELERFEDGPARRALIELPEILLSRDR